MNILNPYEKYKQQSVMAASPGELTLMLFEGCVKFLKLAKESISRKDIQGANNNLIKAQNIISELMTTLDMKYSISQQLLSLYLYAYREITEVNIKKDENKLDSIISLVEEFRDTWQQAIQKDRSQRYDYYADMG